MATGTDIAQRARQLINDVATSFVSGLRWTDAELLQWIADAQREIVSLKPEANTVTDIFVVTGTMPRQQLDPTLAHRLIRVEANGTGTPGEDSGEEDEGTPPVLTGGISGIDPTSAEVSLEWTEAEFADAAPVVQYRLFGSYIEPYPFPSPPTAEELIADGDLTVFDANEFSGVFEYTGLDGTAQFAYVVQALDEDGATLTSNVVTFDWGVE